MSTAVVTPNIPAAPKHLPATVAARWRDKYQKAHAQAKVDHNGNESAARATALKAANALLAVPAPTSAAEIDKLEAWQVLKREDRTVGGEKHRVCVTADGRKHSFPVEETPEEPTGKESGKKKSN